MRLFLTAACVAFACLLPGPLRADPPALDGSWRLIGAEPALPRGDRHKERYETAGVKFSATVGDYYDFMVSGACNSWSSNLEFKSGQLQIYLGSAATTAQFCPDERSDFDRAFGRAMRLADSITITGDTLVTEGESGKLVFERVR